MCVAAGNFAQALALVLVHEGGKSDDPHDPGGKTNWGITHIDYDAYRKSKGLSLQDVYLMTDAERDDIYRTMYWDPVHGDDLPSGLDYVVFDGGVNSGIGQSVKWLQRALPSLPANGRITQALVAAATGIKDQATLIETCCQARLEFLQSLSTFQYFGNGWTKRVNDVQATALTWAAGATPPLPASAATTSQPKALRESAAPLPSTAPGDTTSAATGVALAAAVGAHTVTTPATTPAPASTAPPTSPPTGTPSSPTPTPPASTPPAPTTPPVSAQTSPSTPVAPAAPTTTPQPGTPTVTPVVGATSATPPASTPSTHPTTPAAPSVPAPATTPVKPVVSAPAATTPAAPTPPPTKVASAPAANPSTPTLLNPPNKSAAPPQPETGVAPSPPATTTPAVSVPPRTAPHIVGINDNYYPVTLVALGMLLLFGLYLSFSSRSARTRRSDALGDNPYPKSSLRIGKLVIPAPPQPAAKPPPPQSGKAPALPTLPTTPAGVVSAVEQLPFVQNVWARWASVLWIFATIVVNVITLAELLQQFGFAHETWHQPFLWLSSLYDTYATQAFNATAASAKAEFGINLPNWLLPVFVIYVSSASAFMVASAGLMKRSTTGQSLFGAVIHAGWILAVPAFVLDAIRYRVVATFARQNTVLFFGYVLSLGVAYVVARFINDDILPGFLSQYGAAATVAITKGAAAATALSNELRQ